jgi:hypothetical protein
MRTFVGGRGQPISVQQVCTVGRPRFGRWPSPLTDRLSVHRKRKGYRDGLRAQ